MPSVATSKLLRTSRDSALRTPGIKWVDDGDSGSVRNIVGGRDVRKMNTYQAVRDAMRFVFYAFFDLFYVLRLRVALR